MIYVDHTPVTPGTSEYLACTSPNHIFIYDPSGGHFQDQACDGTSQELPIDISAEQGLYSICETTSDSAGSFEDCSTNGDYVSSAFFEVGYFPTPTPYTPVPTGLIGVDIATNSAFARGLSDYFFVSYFFFLIILLYVGFSFGHYIYRR